MKGKAKAKLRVTAVLGVDVRWDAGKIRYYALLQSGLEPEITAEEATAITRIFVADATQILSNSVEDVLDRVQRVAESVIKFEQLKAQRPARDNEREN